MYIIGMIETGDKTMRKIQFTKKGSAQIFFAEVNDDWLLRLESKTVQRKDGKFGVRPDNKLNEKWTWIPCHPEEV